MAADGDNAELSVAEKILYLQDRWDEIAAQPDDVEITDAQRRELDRRLAADQSDPDAAASWEDVKSRLGPGR